MPLKVLILGANGFIGSSLTHAILKQKDWEVYGMDVGDHKLGHCLGHPRFKFVEGDVTISREWIEYHVKNATPCCRSSPSPTRRSTSRTRCGSSSSISKPTSRPSASA